MIRNHNSLPVSALLVSSAVGVVPFHGMLATFSR